MLSTFSGDAGIALRLRLLVRRALPGIWAFGSPASAVSRNVRLFVSYRRGKAPGGQYLILRYTSLRDCRRDRMIEGYPDDASGFPGDQITFHVATNAPQFNIEFYRQGVVLQDTGVKTDWLVGYPGDQNEPD